MQLHNLVVFLLYLRSGALHSIRIDASRHDAQQQSNMLANGLEVSAGAQEALFQGGFGTGVFRRMGPQAGALHEGSQQASWRGGHLESHRTAPWFRFGPRHAKVTLQAAAGPEADELASKEVKSRMADPNLSDEQPSLLEVAESSGTQLVPQLSPLPRAALATKPFQVPFTFPFSVSRRDGPIHHSRASTQMMAAGGKPTKKNGDKPAEEKKGIDFAGLVQLVLSGAGAPALGELKKVNLDKSEAEGGALAQFELEANNFADKDGNIKKGTYRDEGYVDENYVDPMESLKKMWPFGGGKGK